MCVFTEGVCASRWTYLQSGEALLTRIPFTKTSGAGNDFVIIDDRRGILPEDKAALARVICSRHFGIGADGLLILEESQRASFLMIYYNADGSHGGMCGNGGRCIARYAFLKGIAPAAMRFEALGKTYRAVVEGATVTLHMNDPHSLMHGERLLVNGTMIDGTFIDTGAPHFVIPIDNLESADVQGIGTAVRHHPLFEPEGTNVNFMTAPQGNSISIRTYERGVEEETLACGTGSVACALVASLPGNVGDHVRVRVRSGEELLVRFRKMNSGFSDVSLCGSAHILFTGCVFYDGTSLTVAQ